MGFDQGYFKTLRTGLLSGLLAASTLLVAQEPARPVALKTFKNLYRLNDSIYRSEQPSKKGFRLLEAKGIKSVLNLRRNRDDRKKARDTDLHLKHLPLKSKTLIEADIIEALEWIKSAEKPVLIHCWHGSDRTGVVSAAYRMVVEGWSAEAAIAEFRRPEFGYHENWYPNLVERLQQLDVEAIRAHLKKK